MNETIKVNIFDQTYSLRSTSDDEHVRQIAHIVDERMRLISEQTTTFDLARIAVLAALNIADELERLRAASESSQQSELSTSTDEQGKADEMPAQQETNDGKTSEPQSWFDAIFDAEMPVKKDSERLSSQVSAKLKTLRQDDGKTPIAAVEDAK